MGTSTSNPYDEGIHTGSSSRGNHRCIWPCWSHTMTSTANHQAPSIPTTDRLTRDISFRCVLQSHGDNQFIVTNDIIRTRTQTIVNSFLPQEVQALLTGLGDLLTNPLLWPGRSTAFSTRMPWKKNGLFTGQDNSECLWRVCTRYSGVRGKLCCADQPV